MGLPELRAAIADRFTQRGVATSPDQILITSGALHAFDLLLRTLTGPGDRVLTELPSYPGALDAIRTNGARVVPVAARADGGWDVGAMQAALRQTSPRLAYLIPDYHNPTGGYIDEQQRRDVLQGGPQHRDHGHRRRVVRRTSACHRSRSGAHRSPPPSHRGARFVRRHDRLAVQAGLGRAAHRLGARVDRPGPPAQRCSGRPAT